MSRAHIVFDPAVASVASAADASGAPGTKCLQTSSTAMRRQRPASRRSSGRANEVGALRRDAAVAIALLPLIVMEWRR